MKIRKRFWTRARFCLRPTPSASSELCAKSEEPRWSWDRCSAFRVRQTHSFQLQVFIGLNGWTEWKGCYQFVSMLSCNCTDDLSDTDRAASKWSQDSFVSLWTLYWLNMIYFISALNSYKQHLYDSPAAVTAVASILTCLLASFVCVHLKTILFKILNLINKFGESLSATTTSKFNSFFLKLTGF